MKIHDEVTGNRVRLLISKIEGLHSEIQAGAKRKADAAISPFQLNVVNIILRAANEFAGDERVLDGFEAFDPDDLPTSSDVSMVVSQYVEYFERIRCDNIQAYSGNRWVWTDGTGTFTTGPR